MPETGGGGQKHVLPPPHTRFKSLTKITQIIIINSEQSYTASDVGQPIKDD